MHLPARFFSCSPFPAIILLLDNHLQLPSVTQRVLDDLIARHKDVFALVVVFLLREVYPPILDDPAGLAREVDDAAL